MDLVTLVTACALTVDPKVMHALISQQSGGRTVVVLGAWAGLGASVSNGRRCDPRGPSFCRRADPNRDRRPAGGWPIRNRRNVRTMPEHHCCGPADRAARGAL